MKIRILAGGIRVNGELADTPCAREIRHILPLDAVPRMWGDEFYFPVPVEMPLDESATEEVKVGDIGYWPPGNSLAIFFGPTPLSTGADPVPASAVNRIGWITGDARVLAKARGARRIRIERA
jgi:hypothetical protein